MSSPERTAALSRNGASRANSFNAILARISDVALSIAGIALVGVAGVEAWQVFARYVLNQSPSWTEPVALLLMSTTMMLGAAVGVRAGRHFGFFILAESSRPSIRRVLYLTSNVIAAAIGSMFVVRGAQMLADAWDYPMAGAPLPQGLVFLPMCVGGVLIALFSLERIFNPATPTRGE